MFWSLSKTFHNRTEPLKSSNTSYFTQYLLSLTIFSPFLIDFPIDLYFLCICQKNLPTNQQTTLNFKELISKHQIKTKQTDSLSWKVVSGHELRPVNNKQCRFRSISTHDLYVKGGKKGKHEEKRYIWLDQKRRKLFNVANQSLLWPFFSLVFSGNYKSISHEAWVRIADL